MPSVLTGVDRKLRWSDFNVVAAPPAGAPAAATAMTNPGHTAAGGLPRNIAAAGMTPIFMIPDTLVVNVFLQSDSWRLASVSAWSGADQVWLIKHEQGHYDLYALMVRDFFERIRSLIGQPFTDAAELHALMLDHREATLGKAKTLQKAYEDDTENSRNGDEQWAWWCAIQRAREAHRTPLTRGADGRYLRVELLDALVAAGLSTGD